MVSSPGRFRPWARSPSRSATSTDDVDAVLGDALLSPWHRRVARSGDQCRAQRSRGTGETTKRYRPSEHSVSPHSSAALPDASGAPRLTRHYDSLTYPAIAGRVGRARPDVRWGEPLVSRPERRLRADRGRPPTRRRPAATRRRQAEAGEVLPDDLLPGVGGDPMPLRARARGGRDRDDLSPCCSSSMIETLDQVALQVLAPDIQTLAGRRQDHAAGHHLVRRCRARRGDAPVRVARRPLHAHADPRRRHLVWALVRWRSPARCRPACQMAVVRAGAGFGASARIPISPSLIADQYPIGVRTRMFAAENLGRPAGLVLGPFFVGAVAGWAGGAEGWRWAMVAVAIPALVVALVAVLPAGAGARPERAGSRARQAARRVGRPAGAPRARRRPACARSRASATSSSGSACSASRW